MRRKAWWIAGAMALAIVCASLAGYLAFVMPGPLAAPVAVVIPKGAGIEAIADRLAAGGVIGEPRIFVVAAHLLGNRRALRAGEFLFPARISAWGAMGILVHAKPVMRHLTIAEGLTSAQVLDQLARAEGLEGVAPDSLPEGDILPETYSYTWGDGRGEMVSRMRKAMADTIERLWRERDPKLGLRSAEEAVMLASIIEKETARAEERPHVAAVFLNRLRFHMRLQSDPTVIYALTHGARPLGRALARADLDTPSRYNTYANDGLPPGPIANPGKASLMAVLHPAVSDDLYFAADGTGGHAFARSLAEHNRNVAKLHQMQTAPDGGKSE